MFRKKKKLTLRQIHSLYLVLSYTLPEKESKYLLDEMDEIMSKATEETMKQALTILKIDSKEKSGIQILTLFIRSLKEIDFFSYAGLLQGLKNGNKTT